MMAAACIACGLIAAGCIACALAGDRITGAITRARWNRHCRGKPPRNDGQPLDEREREELITIARGLKGNATRPQRSRT